MSTLSRSELASVDGFVQSKRYSASTQRIYKKILQRFLRSTHSRSKRAVCLARRRRWLKNRARRWPPASLYQHARLVDRFLRWRQDRGERLRNPFTELRRQYGVRARTHLIRALLVKDYRGALGKLRPIPLFGSFLGEQMKAPVALKRALGYRFVTEELEFLRFDRFLQQRPELTG